MASKSLDYLFPPDDHHPPLAVALLVKFHASSLDSYLSHNLWKCDFPAVRASLQPADLSFVIQPVHIDEKFDRLKVVLEKLTLCVCPMKRF